jgi:hypothetical protein
MEKEEEFADLVEELELELVSVLDMTVAGVIQELLGAFDVDIIVSSRDPWVGFVPVAKFHLEKFHKEVLRLSVQVIKIT